MNLTIEEFIKKAEEIDELTVSKVSGVGIYEWFTQGDNYELRDYIREQLTENLTLTDAYLLPEYKKTWIKKSYIDLIINTIKNTENYNEMYENLNHICELKPSKLHDGDKIEFIKIEFTNRYKMEIKHIIINKLKQCNIEVKDIGYGIIKVKNQTCDTKEQCKHYCKTTIKKEKFNKIFNL
jgi:hypothetical protein